MSTSINSNLMTEVYQAHLAAPACIPPKPNMLIIKQCELVNKAPEMHILQTLEKEIKGGENLPDFCLETTKRCLWMTKDTYTDFRILLLCGVLNHTVNS